MNQSTSEILCNISEQASFYGELLVPGPTPQSGGPPLIGCPRLLIQCIRSYPPYLEAVSYIRNQRTRHAVGTWDTHNMEYSWYEESLQR